MAVMPIRASTGDRGSIVAGDGSLPDAIHLRSDVDQSTEISDAQIQQVISDRCVACHAVKPTQAGICQPASRIGTRDQCANKSK